MQDFSSEQLPNILARLSEQLPSGHSLPAPKSSSGYASTGGSSSSHGLYPNAPGIVPGSYVDAGSPFHHGHPGEYQGYTAFPGGISNPHSPQGMSPVAPASSSGYVPHGAPASSPGFYPNAGSPSHFGRPGVQQVYTSVPGGVSNPHSPQGMSPVAPQSSSGYAPHGAPVSPYGQMPAVPGPLSQGAHPAFSQVDSYVPSGGSGQALPSMGAVAPGGVPSFPSQGGFPSAPQFGIQNPQQLNQSSAFPCATKYFNQLHSTSQLNLSALDQGPLTGSDPFPHLTQAISAAAQQVIGNSDVSNAPNSGFHSSSSASRYQAPVSPYSSSSEYAGLQRFVEHVGATSHPHQGGLSASGSNGHFHQSMPPEAIPSFKGSRPFDLKQIRRDFPVLHQLVHGKPLVWFDNAATTQKPQQVIDAIANFYARDNSNIHRAAHTLAARSTDAFEGARQKVQHFLGAGSPQEIIFVRGTTEGINLISHTYGSKFLQPGDEILLTTLEHHANIVPWQLVAKQTGAVIRVVPVTDRGEIMMEEYQRLLGARTKIVAFPHANNSLGTLLPVEEMTHLAKRYNARVLIDGAQSVAHVPVNVQQLGCDFYVFSGHKIFGPTGIGAAYARSEMQEIMPPWQGGGSMIKDVTFEETKYSDPPAKFEAGTPNIADAVGLGAALDYVTAIGLPNIAKHEHDLLEYATHHLAPIPGLKLFGHARKKVAVISFTLPNRSTEEVGRLLDAEGIAVRSGHHCAQPSLRRFGVESTVRPSFSLYNTRDEVDHLVNVVRHIQHR
ncbi:SufS family cysteine desulfurase [Planctomicrobium sp. SH668]|uniref:SufS family cysteine desulfurase n=1 Tax=Planctomicrobium sp. SH668 TaxID=3448126 RepID=UPI003F5C7F9E